MKYLALDGLKQLLAAPQGDGPLPNRNLAILVLMGVHGLRVSAVAGLKLDDVDLNEGVTTVLGKGRKARTDYLSDQTTQMLAAWLTKIPFRGEVRGNVALDDVHARFVVVGPNRPGTAIGAACRALHTASATWSTSI